MKKVILGTIAGIATGYFLRKIQERAYFHEMCDDISGLRFKAKKKFKNAMDRGMNEAEYIKDQVESKANK